MPVASVCGIAMLNVVIALLSDICGAAGLDQRYDLHRVPRSGAMLARTYFHSDVVCSRNHLEGHRRCGSRMKD